MNFAIAELAGRILGDLQRPGQPIGIADSVIAATALPTARRSHREQSHPSHRKSNPLPKDSNSKLRPGDYKLATLAVTLQQGTVQPVLRIPAAMPLIVSNAPRSSSPLL